MNYAAEGDIRRYLGVYAQGWPRADGSPPTVADGLAFAAQASGELDAILSSKQLAIPADGPAQFIEHLRDLAGMYAAAVISAGLFPQAQGPASTTLSGFLMTTYKDALASLRRGEGLPLSATQDTAAMPRSFTTSHPFDDDGNPTDAPVFSMGTKW